MSNISFTRMEEILQYCNENGETDTCQHFNINIESLHRYQRKARFYETKQPKVLLFDIETTPLTVKTWHTGKQRISFDQIMEEWFLLSYSGKWLFDSKVFGSVLTPAEVLHKDDFRITKEIWHYFDQADVIIGHNCVEINTPILKQDLTWCRAGDLKIGDKLVGFEEKTPPNTSVRDKNNKWVGVSNKARKILPSDVTDFHIATKDCVEVLFDNGDKVITTRDHYWLGMAERDRNQRWYKSESLRPGQRINKYLIPWGKDKSYEAGWLSGFISGEGTLKQANGSISIDFCQRPGVTWNTAMNYCKKLSMSLSPWRKPHPSGIGKKDTLYIGLTGGKFKTMEYIGKLQIPRFIEKIKWDQIGGLKSQSAQMCKVVSVSPVGYKNVAVFGTTTKTFIGDGFPMHNCNGFDIPKSQTRFLAHRLAPPSPFQTIDTLLIARKNFRLSSNKLDYIGQLMLNERKLHTEYSLWLRCLEGDPQALSDMLTYNKQDVLLLEDIYVLLRPWVKNHPNMGIFMEAHEPSCPNCGSTDIKECGYYTTSVNRFLAFRCNSCGAVCRSRKSDVPLKCKSGILRSVSR
jgi:hypothetical protein